MKPWRRALPRLSLTGLSRAQLRGWLGAFFLALAVPAGVLCFEAYDQLKWEAFHRQRLLAEELAARIDARLVGLIAAEEARSFTDYGFVVVTGDPGAQQLERSTLSRLPGASQLPGLIGHFQVDADGRFSSPLVPDPTQGAVPFGMPETERRDRVALAQQMREILQDNRLLADPRQPPAEMAAGAESASASDAPANDLGGFGSATSAVPSYEQQVQSSLGRIEELELDARYDRASKDAASADAASSRALPAQRRSSRKELNVVPAPPAAPARRVAEGYVEALTDGDAASSAGASAAAKASMAESSTAGAQRARVDAGDSGAIPSSSDRPLAAASSPGKARSSQYQAETSASGSEQRKLRAAVAQQATSMPSEKARDRSVPAATAGLGSLLVGSALDEAARDDVVLETLEHDAPAGADADRGTGVRAAPRANDLRIATFESELDPFEFALLASGHFVLYRKAWRDGQRIVQGALLGQQGFLREAIETPYRGTVLSRTSNLGLAYRGELLRAFGAQTGRRYLDSMAELSGALLLRTKLSAPLGDLELAFTAERVPVGPGGQVILGTAAVLAVVALFGFGLTYRLAVRQIDLVRQQHDFVSAVSHELRTPLTSIRMYAEMLREGWASAPKQREYHDYILSESERLSRLISNVLQLARITRTSPEVNLEQVAVGTLVEDLAGKVRSQVEQAGFELVVACDEAVRNRLLSVDMDFTAQVIINLVDNALKFAGRGPVRRIELVAQLTHAGALDLSVRDHGPGIAPAQARKIFALFYRAENELTRETVGTGIGLALVRQLAELMGAEVQLDNAVPGARFTIRFPPRALDGR